jgi:hypothetical protein
MNANPFSTAFSTVSKAPPAVAPSLFGLNRNSMVTGPISVAQPLARTGPALSLLPAFSQSPVEDTSSPASDTLSAISGFSEGFLSISAESHTSKSGLTNQYDNLLADELTILDVYANSFEQFVKFLFKSTNQVLRDFLNPSLHIPDPSPSPSLVIKDTKFHHKWENYQKMVRNLNDFIGVYNGLRRDLPELSAEEIGRLINEVETIKNDYKTNQLFIEDLFNRQLRQVLTPATKEEILRAVRESVDYEGNPLTESEKTKLKIELFNSAISSKWERFKKIPNKLDQVLHKLKLRQFIVKTEAAKHPDARPSVLSKVISATNALATYAAEKLDLDNLNEPARSGVAVLNDDEQADLLIAALIDAQNKAREIKLMFSDLDTIVNGANAYQEQNDESSQLSDEGVPAEDTMVMGEQSHLTTEGVAMIRSIHEILATAENADIEIGQLDEGSHDFNTMNAKLTTINDGINRAVSIVGDITKPILVSSDSNEQSEINAEMHDLITSVQADIPAEARAPSPDVGMPNVGMSNVGMPGGKKTNKTTRKRKANKSKPKRKRTVKRRLTKRRNARKARGKRTMKNRAK